MRVFPKNRIKESAENHTIELVYSPNISLTCPDYPNEKWIETEDYGFWNSVDREIRRTVAADNDLTEFIPDELKGRVYSVKLEADENNNLHVNCITSTVDDGTKAALINWVDGQMSDGWGENFEQEELGTTQVYACYNEDDPDEGVEFYSDSRTAQQFCDEQNEWEDEDDEDYEAPNYVYEPVDVYATCSYWKQGKSGPTDIYIDGFNADNLDKDGFNKEGFNLRGFNREGFNKEGFNRDGFDKDGFNKEGFNAEGKDRDGFDRSGAKSSGVKGVNVDRGGKAFVADPYSGLHESKQKIKESKYVPNTYIENYEESDDLYNDAMNIIFDVYNAVENVYRIKGWRLGYFEDILDNELPSDEIEYFINKLANDLEEEKFHGEDGNNGDDTVYPEEAEALRFALGLIEDSKNE